MNNRETPSGDAGRPHLEWLADVGEELKKDYQRQHALAVKDPQQAGHAAETAWARFLRDWLPVGYEVLTRKYVIPEVAGLEPFESDIVIVHPSCPPALKSRTQIPIGMVLAAFSVRLTLDRDGIKDAYNRAIQLKSYRRRTPRNPAAEMIGPVVTGLLAHSHRWSNAGSKPRENVWNALYQLDMEQASHPREGLDLVCVADLGTWYMARLPYLPPMRDFDHPGASPEQLREGFAITSVMEANDGERPPFAVLMSRLCELLLHLEPGIEPLARAFRATDVQGGGGGNQRLWSLSEVFTSTVRAQLPARANNYEDPLWGFH